MDLLTKFTKDKIFSDRILPSSYEQGKHTNSKQVFPSILDLFFSVYDHHYSFIENKDKLLYVKQLIMNIATEIDENKQHKYDNFNYLKCMNMCIIFMYICVKLCEASAYLCEVIKHICIFI